MKKVWNEKDFNSIAAFVNPEYSIHIDTGDPWEGKTLNHQEFETRLNYSFNSFPDIQFEIQHAISDGYYVVLIQKLIVMFLDTMARQIKAYQTDKKTA